ncbi:MAG: LptA/OstA family protein [Gammaproteobacteria bacterium]
MNRLAATSISVFALAATFAAVPDVLQLSNDTTIVVSADEAWEEEQDGILHFRGNFEIRTPRWIISADRASVHGKLDDPQYVVAEGSPVKFFFRHANDEAGGATRAEGRHLEYDKARNLLRLSGNATISGDRRMMRSSEIQYDLEREELTSGGPEGVHVTVEPDDTGEF